MSNPEPLPMEGEVNLKEIDKAEEIVERYKGATRKLSGLPAFLITLVAIGGSVFSLYAAPTTMLSWKYTLPAFLVPFMFTSHPSGVGLLLKGDLMNIILTNLTALVGVGVLAAGMSGWLFRRTVWVERVLLIVAGFILVYLAPLADVVGVTLAAAVASMQWLTRTSADKYKKGIAINP
jgi:TRAP-type uncharacterized transport system fused permease subunit